MAVVVGSTWDATAAVRACSLEPWVGSVWRVHASRFAGDSSDGSLRVSGRFHRAPDKYLTDTWKALYTALAPEIALAEIVRHFTLDNLLHKVRDQRMSRLQAELQVVVRACTSTGCFDLNVPGVSKDDFCHPTNFEKTHAFARAARECAEGLLVPSCTGLPQGNLIIFPDRLLPGSAVWVEEYRDLQLYAG